MTPFALSLIANIIVSLISLIGAIAFFGKRSTSRFFISNLISFAAGIMLGAAFFDILPEAFDQNAKEYIFWFILIGISVSFFMERFLLWYHHHHEDTHNIKPSAALVLFGDMLHNFVDGVAIMTSFAVNPAIGMSTTIAIAAHEIPQELADFSILLHAGMTKKRALFLNFITALTAVLGAIVTYIFLSYSHSYIGFILSFTGGMFVYIALADLVPDLHREKNIKNVIFQSTLFLLGIVLMYIVSNVLS